MNPLQKKLLLLLLFLTPCIFLAAEEEAPHASDAAANRAELKARLHALEAAGAEGSGDPELRGQYLETVTALGYHDLAAETYQRMTAETPDDPELWLALGNAWANSGPYGREKAFAAFKHAITLKADNTEAIIALAHLLHREGLYEAAEGYYDTILALAPEHVRARLGKAVLLARRGEIPASSALFDAVGNEGQQYDVETRLMLRRALYVFEHRGGRLDDTAENHKAYARLLYRAGRIADAMLAARRTVVLDASDYVTWNFIAAMHLQIGNVEQAEQAYGSSLSANPDQPAIESARRQIINELTLQQQKKMP